MKISDNFSMEEFIKSDTANKYKIINKPNLFEQDSIIKLVKHVMQPIRNHFKTPVIITSGFRSKELNLKIGGAINSQHTKGEACDFVVKGIENKTVFDYILKNIIFDQLILEPSWIHVSYNSLKNRQEYWRA